MSILCPCLTNRKPGLFVDEQDDEIDALEVLEHTDLVVDVDEFDDSSS